MRERESITHNPSDTFKSSGCAERSVCYGAKQHTRSGPGYEDDLWGVLRARNPSYRIPSCLLLSKNSSTGLHVLLNDGGYTNHTHICGYENVHIKRLYAVHSGITVMNHFIK